MQNAKSKLQVMEKVIELAKVSSDVFTKDDIEYLAQLTEDLKRQSGPKSDPELTTDSECAVYWAVVNYTMMHGYPPTVREIGEIVGLKSTSSVHYYIRKLLEAGILETDAEEGYSRAIRVPGYKFTRV